MYILFVIGLNYPVEGDALQMTSKFLLWQISLIAYTAPFLIHFCRIRWLKNQTTFSGKRYVWSLPSPFIVVCLITMLKSLNMMILSYFVLNLCLIVFYLWKTYCGYTRIWLRVVIGQRWEYQKINHNSWSIREWLTDSWTCSITDLDHLSMSFASSLDDHIESK